jgi:hypothetical protein
MYVYKRTGSTGNKLYQGYVGAVGAGRRASGSNKIILVSGSPYGLLYDHDCGGDAGGYGSDALSPNGPLNFITQNNRVVIGDEAPTSLISVTSGTCTGTVKKDELPTYGDGKWMLMSAVANYNPGGAASILKHTMQMNTGIVNGYVSGSTKRRHYFYALRNIDHGYGKLYWEDSAGGGVRTEILPTAGNVWDFTVNPCDVAWGIGGYNWINIQAECRRDAGVVGTNNSVQVWFNKIEITDNANNVLYRWEFYDLLSYVVTAGSSWRVY